MYFSDKQGWALKALLPLLATGSVNSNEFWDEVSCDACCYEYAYNIPTRQSSCCPWDGHVDYLYLEARNNFAPIILSSSTAGPNSSSDDFDNNRSAVSKELAYEWRGGFRIGIGANLPCDTWALNLDWFHYRTEGHVNAVSSANTSVFGGQFGTSLIPADVILGGTFLGQGTGTGAAEIDVLSTIHVNQIDLQIGREYFLTSGISLLPTVGLAYLDLRSTADTLFSIANKRSKNEQAITRLAANAQVLAISNRFYGLGIQGGLASNWNLGCGFGIWGNGQASLLWGRFKTTARATQSPPTIKSEIVRHNLVPAFEFGIGVDWDHAFSDCSVLKLKAGWEGMFFYDQTGITFAPELVSSPLTLQGLILSVSYSM